MTALVKKVDAEFGKALIEAARAKESQELQEAVISEVRNMMGLAEKQEELAEGLTKSAAALRRRLAAIEEGKFAFDNHKRIKYLDGEENDIIYKESMELLTRMVSSAISSAYR